MCIIDRCTDPGGNIAVLDHALLQEGDIDNLPDKRAGEGLEPHVLDPVLDIESDLLRDLFGCPVIAVKSFNEFGLFYDLVDNALSVPFDDMAIGCADIGEYRDGNSLKGQLSGFAARHQSPEMSLII